MLLTGNFAYAVTHLDCIVDDVTHHECEMECCKEGNCCSTEEEQTNLAESLASDDMCCEVHIEQAIEQDYAVLLIEKTTEKQFKSSAVTASVTSIQSKQDYTNLITHRFKTTNIYLSVSNLRI